MTPCKRGHTGGRYKSNGVCIQCAREYSRAYHSDIGKGRQYNRRRRLAKFGLSIADYELLLQIQKRALA